MHLSLASIRREFVKRIFQILPQNIDEIIVKSQSFVVLYSLRTVILWSSLCALSVLYQKLLIYICHD